MAEPLPDKIRDLPGQTEDREHLLDRVFFGFGALAAVWLASAIVQASFDGSWWLLSLLVLFWAVLAYLALPRLNQILTSIYVPGYYIGRTRTSDGLLGDPLNLAFRGSAEQLSSAFARAGWVPADPVTWSSSLRIVTSTLARRTYSEAPVSPLLLFGRQQDVAYQQEVAGNPAQRHHLRLWRTPDGWLLPGGHRVDWLGAGTYDRRVGLSLFTLQVTHKIDADIDVERDFIVTSLTAAEPRTEVEPLLDFTTGYHSRNGGGDLVHTDGTLPVVDLVAVAPDPAATDFSTGPVRMPAAVPLAALLAIVLGPLALLEAVVQGETRDSDRWLLVLVAVLAAGAVACTVAMLVRRSAWARRFLLVLAGLIVLSQVRGYELAREDLGRLLATYHAGVMILAVLALSSPPATAWCRGRPVGRPGRPA